MTKPIGSGQTFWTALTEEQFACLGKIAALFGQIETYLDMMVAELGGIRDQATLEIFYDGKQFGSKVSLLRKLATSAPTATKDAVTVACAALDRVASARNQAIHGQWGVIDHKGDPTHGKVVAASLKTPNRFLNAEGLATVLNHTELAARAVMTALALIKPVFSGRVLPIHRGFQFEPTSSPAKSGKPSRMPSASPSRKK